jgi:hypothetical protein
LGVIFLYTYSSLIGDERGGGWEKEIKWRKKKWQDPENSLNFRNCSC